MSFFAQTGTESVEAALKLARYSRARPRFIGFLGGFHGSTMGSLSFTSSKYTQQKGFFPSMPGRDACAVSEQLSAAVRRRRSGPRGAALYRGRVVRAQRARERSGGDPDRADSGRGRLPGAAGRLSAGPARAVRPARDSADIRRGAIGHRPHRQDVRRPALGCRSGHHDAGEGARLRDCPSAWSVAKRSIMQKWTRGAHGNTYGGNPLCCAAALATIDLIEREYCANAAKVGDYFMRKLRGFAEKFPWSAKSAARD